LQNDDVIVAVNQTEIKDVAGLDGTIEGLVRDRTDALPVLITFDRASERMLTVLEVGRPGVQDPGMEARKAWVAVSVQALTREIAEQLGIPGKSGVRITGVMGGSAAAAGLKIGDVITAIDGDPVQASQPSESDVFHTMIRQYKIGSTVMLNTLRGKEERSVKLTLDSSPRLAREMKKYEDPAFEFRVRDIAETDRRELGMPASEKGVLVEAVSEGGWAALAHLGDGDMILAIDGEPVADVAAVKAKMEKVAAAKPAAVVLHVRRGIRTFFVEMETGFTK
jgi:S1-C subfamily serine protease